MDEEISLQKELDSCSSDSDYEPNENLSDSEYEDYFID